MDDVNIITWLWGDKYPVEDVAKLARAVRKNLRVRHRFNLFSHSAYNLTGVVTHQIEDAALCDRSCFCRLRMFDPQWQRSHGITGWILALDLDVVITGSLDDLFTGTSTFKILQNVNEKNPNPFNASVMLLKAGHHAEVWQDFTIKKAHAVPFHSFPDDQGWIWHKLPNADGWRGGKESGIYAFQKPGWPVGNFALPKDARIVAFFGKRKPRMYSWLPWVKEYWQEV